MAKPIPAPLVALVADFCAEQETHASLDSLFMYAEASRDPPAGSKPVKAQSWLRETNKVHPDSRTRDVLDWKASCERRFVYNAANAVSNADRNAVLQKFQVRRAILERFLSAGLNELRQLAQHAQSRRAVLMPQPAEAANRFAQFEADLSVFK